MVNVFAGILLTVCLLMKAGSKGHPICLNIFFSYLIPHYCAALSKKFNKRGDLFPANSLIADHAEK